MRDYIVKVIGWCILLPIAFVAFYGVIVVLPILPPKVEEARVGVTFSAPTARYFDLDWQQVYKDILSELNPDIIRIPVYWEEIEPEQDSYTWDDLDFLLEELLVQEKDTEVILAIGHKVPRWPECYVPEWVDDNPTMAEEQLMQMLSEVVLRYKDHPNVYAWQVENEALFDFGDCPEWSRDRARLKREIELVRSIDNEHKIMTSDSGELSLWLRTSTLPIDTLAISLYRAVYNESITDDREDLGHGYYYWPVNPYYYRLHAFLVKPFVQEFIISELQMEPWGPRSIKELSEEEVYLSFNPIEFTNRIDFASRTGATTILTWGVEWWYYMKEVKGNSAYWEQAIHFFESY